MLHHLCATSKCDRTCILVFSGLTFLKYYNRIHDEALSLKSEKWATLETKWTFATKPRNVIMTPSR